MKKTIIAAIAILTFGFSTGFFLRKTVSENIGFVHIDKRFKKAFGKKPTEKKYYSLFYLHGNYYALECFDHYIYNFAYANYKHNEIWECINAFVGLYGETIHYKPNQSIKDFAIWYYECLAGRNDSLRAHIDSPWEYREYYEIRNNNEE